MVKTIKQSVTFAATPHELYELYMDAKKHAKALGTKVVVQKKPWTKFSAWDGYCWGEMMYVHKDEAIVQTWRAADWTKSDPDSILLIAFRPKGKGTEVTLVHAGVPDGMAASLAQGWKEHYWDNWKAHLKAR
jgi:activator of HSP90 ATPase